MLLENTSNVRYCSSNGSSESQEFIDSSKSIRNHSFLEENDLHEIDSDKLVDHLASKLVNDTVHFDDEESINTTLLKLNKIEYGYNSVTEDLSIYLNRWLDLRKIIITSLHGAEGRFRLIHRTTEGITLASSILEMVTRAGLIFHDIFDYDSSFSFKLISVLGGISLTSSLVALSYSKTALEDVSRKMRDEKRLHIDLETIYRKGNCIDASVQKLFPHGIDLSLMDDAMCKLDAKNGDKRRWKHQLCSVILSTNFRKDINIVNDESFLKTLKAFAQSNAAQLWLYRIRMRKLLDEMAEINLKKKELSSSSEAFLGISAVNLYPVFLSLLFNSENFDKFRLISSTLTAIIMALKIARKEKDEFREMKQMSRDLLKEYKKIKKINRYVLSDYE